MKPNQNQDNAKMISSSAISGNNFINEIDALYKSQIKQIYASSREKAKETVHGEQKLKMQSPKIKKNIQFNQIKEENQVTTSLNPNLDRDRDARIKKLNVIQKIDEQKVRASTFLQGESTRTIEILRKQNQTKEMKIRELTNKCQNLIEKLKSNLTPQEFETELENLKEFSDRKMQRLQNLFKIKNEEIFFKIKLQIIGLLQEFQVSKQQIAGINEVNNESTLFSFMVRKLKIKLKDFRSKEQESNFEIQKDKILNQKNEERIHYLMETNELLKLSETKLKNKIDDLRGQLNAYLQKIKGKELQIQEKQNEIFRLKKQNEELQVTNQKMSHSQRNITSEKNDEKRIYEAKQKQMKALLSSYYVQRKKLQNELQEKQGYIEEILIKQKFLQQENERINREYVRWKERYEWLQKQKQNRQREFEEEKFQLQNEFEEYKRQNNQGMYMSCKTETDEALRKVEEYQTAYQKISIELEEERRISLSKQDEAQKYLEEVEREWFDKIKRIEKMKEEELYDIAYDHENRQKQIREEYEKREELLGEEMQAKMKALIAEKIRNMTQKLIHLQSQNEEVKRQNENLNKLLQVKESIINVINKQ